ncbi:MAG: PD-(D/E)XK nuclease family protein, partial [Clostridiales bacterium]|nr:PD-(D/E)XK nuclease family protein [Clostridiales bacterium]
FTAQEAALIDVNKIADFAATPLVKRWAATTRTLREAAFTYALPATELMPAAAPQDKLVLQGVIDAAFWDDDGWVLLDYKTGGYGRTEQELIESYATQLIYYRRALRDIWREPVKEMWLCFIDLGKNVEITITE